METDTKIDLLIKRIEMELARVESEHRSGNYNSRLKGWKKVRSQQKKEGFYRRDPIAVRYLAALKSLGSCEKKLQGLRENLKILQLRSPSSRKPKEKPKIKSRPTLRTMLAWRKSLKNIKLNPRTPLNNLKSN
ncbi:hypothetical protein GUJ93_ZPchr0004g39893 [Zizania palustris]|uniref:Uncharacterized protein n=1 Tax=Zizania palustris TaxID=103762 RepID=A0A8J5VZC1_ZIZPA|nr:hypothetical protein GUJ93_ZPchr0004g39893 [Zizania palustris]